MPLNEPSRRDLRRTHLDASVVPVERALLARAGVLEGGEQQPGETDIAFGMGLLLAQEFRALAEELHWW